MCLECDSNPQPPGSQLNHHSTVISFKATLDLSNMTWSRTRNQSLTDINRFYYKIRKSKENLYWDNSSHICLSVEIFIFSYPITCIYSFQRFILWSSLSRNNFTHSSTFLNRKPLTGLNSKSYRYPHRYPSLNRKPLPGLK